MTKASHRIYISTLSLIVIVVFLLLSYRGYQYYRVSMEERFFHPDYKLLKPSGVLGHGAGIVGSALMIIGVAMYMIRKRVRRFSRVGLLKHWLEFHIFLCTLGPILVLFHTSFKFGGIVSVSFWSMVIVFLSGIVGRFIYIQIPRTIEGRELSLSEVTDLKTDIGGVLTMGRFKDEADYDELKQLTKKKVGVMAGNFFIGLLRNYGEDKRSLNRAQALIKKNGLAGEEYKRIIRLLKDELKINRKIERLQKMKNWLKYWHVAHLPFAVIMFIIMIVHVVITLMFGYKWIF